MKAMISYLESMRHVIPEISLQAGKEGFDICHEKMLPSLRKIILSVIQGDSL
jgi:hypothetical protein